MIGAYAWWRRCRPASGVLDGTRGMATRFWDGLRDACDDAGSGVLPDACGQQDTPPLGRFAGAGLLAHGSARLSGLPGAPHQWPFRQTLAAHSCGGSAGITRQGAPASLLAPDQRENLDPSIMRRVRNIVNDDIKILLYQHELLKQLHLQWLKCRRRRKLRLS